MSGGYDLYRPRYPQWVLDILIRHLADSTAAHPLAHPLWLDVGSGTGIFARQLADVLPTSTRIIGIEPSEAMRQQATAAHWFDRPAFYAEAYRTLKPGGFLAIIEYVRDLHGSAAARDLQAYLRRAGDGDGYDRPDYEQEFSYLGGFETITIMRDTETLSLSHDAYLGLAFSSSHISACVKRLGEERVRADLSALAAQHSDAKGHIDYGYRMQIFVARKNMV